jgi:3-phenylpropionate/cinnamic acid dioxygenase small subunit
VLAETKPLRAVTPGSELYLELVTLNNEYADALDNERYDEFPEFFTDDCLYRVVPRENYLLGLPIAVIHCESKGMVKDRVYAAQESTMAEPRTFRHFISNIRVLEASDRVVRAQANVLIVQTMINRMTEIMLSGFYQDRIVRRDGRLLFEERLCVYDSLLLPTSMIAPV